MATKRIYELTNTTTLNSLDKLPVDRSGATARSILATDFATAVRPYASQAEAQAGVATDKTMTPARTFDAWDAKWDAAATTFGKSLVDDADASAARSTLGLAAVAASGSATDLTTGTLPIARIADGAVTNAKIGRAH